MNKEKETKIGKEKDKRMEKEDRWQNRMGRKNKCKEERHRKREGEEVVLDSPPLGLISFCILYCVPAG